MSIFDEDIVENQDNIKIDESNREVILLDYAFDQFSDLMMIKIDAAGGQYSDKMIIGEFESFFRHMFDALDHGVPLPWFPDYMAPYKIIYLTGMEFKTDKEYITAELNYLDDNISKKRTYVFNKSCTGFW